MVVVVVLAACCCLLLAAAQPDNPRAPNRTLRRLQRSQLLRADDRAADALPEPDPAGDHVRYPRGPLPLSTPALWHLLVWGRDAGCGGCGGCSGGCGGCGCGCCAARPAARHATALPSHASTVFTRASRQPAGVQPPDRPGAGPLRRLAAPHLPVRSGRGTVGDKSKHFS